MLSYIRIKYSVCLCMRPFDIDFFRSMAVQSKTFEAAVVNVGAFKLSAGL